MNHKGARRISQRGTKNVSSSFEYFMTLFKGALPQSILKVSGPKTLKGSHFQGLPMLRMCD